MNLNYQGHNTWSPPPPEILNRWLPHDVGDEREGTRMCAVSSTRFFIYFPCHSVYSNTVGIRRIKAMGQPNQWCLRCLVLSGTWQLLPDTNMSPCHPPPDARIRPRCVAFICGRHSSSGHGAPRSGPLVRECVTVRGRRSRHPLWITSPQTRSTSDRCESLASNRNPLPHPLTQTHTHTQLSSSLPTHFSCASWPTRHGDNNAWWQ